MKIMATNRQNSGRRTKSPALTLQLQRPTPPGGREGGRDRDGGREGRKDRDGGINTRVTLVNVRGNKRN